MTDKKLIDMVDDTREAPKPLVATGHVIDVRRVVGKHFYATLDNGLMRYGIMDNMFVDEASQENIDSELMKASDSEFVDHIEALLS